MRPPLLYGITLLAALLLHWLRPLRISEHRGTLWPGLLLVAVALAVAIPGRRALRAAGTNVDPSLPTTAIVTAGPYRFTRNPLYVGLTLLYSGLTLLCNTMWGMILLVPLLVIMHLGVILREEQYLDLKFGQTYREYRSRVRRYL